MKIQELTDSYATLRLPPARDVAMSRRVASIVDHPHFQRLRRVRQLGPIQLVYPGATHTRFEHSIGVYGNVLDYLRALLADPNVAQSMSEADIVVAFLAGLLHDIGHYPFAHSLEATHVGGLHPPRHEDLAEHLIFGTLPGSKGPSIATEIERGFGVDAAEVVALIRQKPEQHPAPMRALVATIISSAIDADKADYLERDAHHMGLPYGALQDRGRMLRALVAHPDGRRIALRNHGRMAAESFLFARYALFSEGYWHHTARAVASMVEAALRDYLQQSQLEGQELTPMLVHLDDERFLETIAERAQEGSAAHALLSALTSDRRALHKRLLTLSRAYDDVAIRSAYEKVYALDAAGLEQLRQLLAEVVGQRLGRSLAPWELLIDTPPRDKDRMEDVDIVDSRGAVSSLAQGSQVVRGIAGDFAKVVKKIRVFVAPDIRNSLRVQGLDAETQAAALDAIMRFDASAAEQPSLFE